MIVPFSHRKLNDFLNNEPKNISLFKVNMPTVDRLHDILHSGFIGQGKYVNEFETKFAEKFSINKNNILSVNSCTSAIQLALDLCDLKKGDKIATTPYTCLATNSDILRRDLDLIWYDIDKKTGLANYEEIKKILTPEVKIVIITHLSGTITRDFDLIIEECHKRDIVVIEDAAQSLGSKYNGNYIHPLSDYVCFSFQAIKHLTTIDGGMLYSNDSDKICRGKKLRWFGFDRELSSDFRCKQNINELGRKIHMTDLNAYIGIESLKIIDSIINKHKNNAKIYESLLKDIKEIEICHGAKSDSSFWVYPILVKNNRNELKDFLEEKHIHTSLIQNRLDDKTCFKKYHKNLLNLEYFINKILHIPCGWWISETDIEFIVDNIRLFFDNKK